MCARKTTNLQITNYSVLWKRLQYVIWQWLIKVCKISSRYLKKWLSYDMKHVKHTLFTSFRDLTVIFRVLFFDRILMLQKSVLWSFFAVYGHFSQLYITIFWFDLLYLVTWCDLDLYYGHKAQVMILTNVIDTIHADSLALFTLEVLLAHVTKTIWKSQKWNTSGATTQPSWAPGPAANHSTIWTKIIKQYENICTLLNRCV